jgi:Alpha galactosidase A
MQYRSESSSASRPGGQRSACSPHIFFSDIPSLSYNSCAMALSCDCDYSWQTTYSHCSSTTFPMFSLAYPALSYLAPTMDWPSRRRWGKRCSPVSSAIYLRRRWNSYNHYSCSPNESIIMSNAQAVVDLGLRDLGYLYVETDCGWSVPHRLHNGSITWNETLFPAGFPALGNFIHNLGLRFGVYADSGI